MPTAPTIFRSSDASAPVLTGAVGALIGVLDACLVNGYGSKTALGWTTEFTGTNLRVWRNVVASGATGFRLRGDDTAANTTLLRGWESASAISTTSNGFPTVAQVSDTFQKVYKSAAAGATVRDWVLIGDAKRFYLGIDLNSATPRVYTWFYFGDFISHRPADAANVACFGYSDANASNGFGLGYGASTAWSTTVAASPPSTSGSVARAYTGVAGATYVTATRYGGAAMNVGVPYPGAIANEFIFGRAYINEGGLGTRGEMPGLFVTYHGNNFTGAGLSEIPFASIPGFTGRTFILFNSNFGGSTSHVLMFETTGDSW